MLDSSGNIIATTTTDTNGDYTFKVPAGSYFVVVSDTHNVLDDYTVSPLGNQSSDSTNKQQPYPVTVGDGETNTKGDFGYYRNVTTPAGVIGNQVWYETDHDGLYEPQNGEIGVAGVVVQLTPPANVDAGAGLGQPITTMTGADGGYAFTSLPAATYSVQVIDTFGILTGYQVTTLGAARGADNNNQDQQPGYSVALPANGINTTADFGYWIPGGAIGDYVWYDADKDGLQDVGEPGIGNVTIRLLKDTNNSGTVDAVDVVVGTTTTDANGGYIFKDLPAATYFVDVTDTGGVLTGYTPTGGLGPESQIDPFKVILATGQVVHNADFGYYQPTDRGQGRHRRHGVVGHQPERDARSG